MKFANVKLLVTCKKAKHEAYKKCKIDKGTLYLTNNRILIIADKTLYRRDSQGKDIGLNGFSIKSFKIYDDNFNTALWGGAAFTGKVKNYCNLF